MKLVHENVTTRAKRASATPKRKVIEMAVFVDNELYRRLEAKSSSNVIQTITTRTLDIMKQVSIRIKHVYIIIVSF